MYTPEKNKKKFSLMAVFGLILIFSFIFSQAALGEALDPDQVTETIAIAGEDFEDTVGDGVGTKEASLPTPEPPGADGGAEDDGPPPTDPPVPDPTHSVEALGDEDGGTGEDDGEEGTGGDDAVPPGDNDDDEGTGGDDEVPPGDNDGDEVPAGDNDDDEGTGEEGDEVPGGDDEDDVGTGGDDDEVPAGDDGEEGTGGDDDESPAGDNDDDEGTGEEGDEAPAGDDDDAGTGEDDDEVPAGDDGGNCGEEGEPACKNESVLAVEPMLMGVELCPEGDPACADEASFEEGDVTFSVQCNETYVNQWTVTNNSDVKIYFKYRVKPEGDDWGTWNGDWIKVNKQSSSSFARNPSAETMNIKYSPAPSVDWGGWPKELTAESGVCTAPSLTPTTTDLSIEITGFQGGCETIPVTITVTNNSAVDATGVNVTLTSSSSYFSSVAYDSPGNTGLSISAGSSVDVEATITTGGDWLTLDDTAVLPFTVAITAIDQTDSDSTNNSADANASNPGDCGDEGGGGNGGNSDVCPGASEGWDKVEGLSGTSYTHDAPEGKLIAEACWKASTYKEQYDVIPNSPSHTVVSTEWNKTECIGEDPTDPPAGCAIQNLSHASFRYVDIPPKDPTISVYQGCTWDGASKAVLTVIYSSDEIETLWWNLTGNPSDNAVYSGPITATLTSGTLHVSWQGKTGYNDDSLTHSFDVGTCAPPDLSITVTGNDKSCEDFSFTIDVKNLSPDTTATNAAVSVNLTGGTTYVDDFTSNPYFTYTFGDIPPNSTKSTILNIDIKESSWIPAAKGTAITFDIFATSDQDSTQTSGTATHPGGCEKSGLSIEITGGGKSCEDFSFDIKVTNDAQYTTMTAVGLTVDITSGSGFLADFTSNSYLDVSLGDMAPGASITTPLSMDTIDALWKPAPAGTLIEFKAAAVTSNGFSTDATDAAEHPGGCSLSPEIDYKCQDYDNSHMWVIDNLNPFAIQFTWKFDTDAGFNSSWKTIAAGGKYEFPPSSSLAQSLTIKYKYGEEDEIPLKTVFAEACKSTSLDIGFVCGYASDSALFWQVENPFEDKALTFTWKVSGSSESGSETVPAGGTVGFETSLGKKTVIIYVNGNEIDRADSGAPCRFEPALSYVCLDNGNHYWTVSNTNFFAISYTWYLDGEAQSKVTIPAGKTKHFTTGNGEHSVMLKYVDGLFGSKIIRSNAKICEVPPPPLSPPSSPPITGTITCPQWIIFHTMRDGNMEVYRLDGIEGIGAFQLVNLSKHDAVDARPSRSFDDEWVAFQSDRDGNTEIYYTDNMGRSQFRLTENEAEDINPMFGPDNINIVFQSNRNGKWDLFMINRLTGEETQLTDNENDEINPFFSYDGNYLVFESNRNGNWDIFLLNLATGNEYQITDGEGDEIYPALSPNGQKIAFLSQVDGIWNVFVIGIDGQNQIQITDSEGNSFNHAWSPDSTRLAYQSQRDDNMDIYSFDLRNNTEYRVTDNPGKDTGPTWDCGGTNLAFTTIIDDNEPDIYRAYWKGGGFSYLTNHLDIDEWSEWSPAKETASRGR